LVRDENPKAAPAGDRSPDSERRLNSAPERAVTLPTTVAEARRHRGGAGLAGRPSLALVYAEALTARFLKAPEGRNARLNGLVTLGVVDYLIGVRGVRPRTARVEDIWSFLFEELPRVGWVSVSEVPSALAELRAFWRFLVRVDAASRRVELQGFLSRSSTAKALAERLKACADDTVDMAPF